MSSSAQLSIVSGAPLSSEPLLGALTIPAYLKEITARFGPREALVLHTRDEVIRWTYDTLWERSMELARALAAIGVGKQSRVGLLISNRPEFVAAAFGIALAGGVSVVLSTFSTAAELEHLIKVSGISVRFDRSWPAGFTQRGHSVPPASVEVTISTTKPTDAAILFFSSGATGLPKGILHTHQAAAIQWWRWPRVIGVRDGERCWTANGFFWSGQFSMALGCGLSVGGTVVLQPTFDPEEALELMKVEQVTLPFAWPHQWAKLEAARTWSSADLSSLRYVDLRSPLARHPTVTRRRDWHEPPACRAGCCSSARRRSPGPAVTRSRRTPWCGVPPSGCAARSSAGQLNGSSRPAPGPTTESSAGTCCSRS